MIFLIADLRKFYQVSNSIAESPIWKEIFIIVEQRKFFQVFYCGIANPWTQNLWMLNTRLLEFFLSRFFIKELSKKQITEICLNTFFLNYNCCCCCCSSEDSTVEKTSIFKGLFWTCKSILFLNPNEFYYFFVSVPLLCALFSAQIFFGDYCQELNVWSFDWTLKCNNFSNNSFHSI